MKKTSWKNMNRSLPVKNAPQLLPFNVFGRNMNGADPFVMSETYDPP